MSENRKSFLKGLAVGLIILAFAGLASCDSRKQNENELYNRSVRLVMEDMEEYQKSIDALIAGDSINYDTFSVDYWSLFRHMDEWNDVFPARAAEAKLPYSSEKFSELQESGTVNNLMFDLVNLSEGVIHTFYLKDPQADKTLSNGEIKTASGDLMEKLTYICVPVN